MSDNKPGRFVTANQAAKRLGVKVETIYAYVSRGVLVRRRDQAQGFASADVERLAVRGRRTTGPKPAPLAVLSELTELAEAGLFYRGRDAVALARTRSFESVAQLLWLEEASETDPPSFVASRPAVALAAAMSGDLPEAALPLDQLRVIVAVLGSCDALRYDTTPDAVLATARGLIAGMIESLPRTAAKHDGKPKDGATLAQRLWQRLSTQPPSAAKVQVLDFALGLCADHALSPSTLAVRIAASQRADPYSVVQTGLGALGGTLHGPASLSAEAYLREVEAGAAASDVIGQRLRRAERIAGFGHAQHTRGDPRAAALLQAIDQSLSHTRGAQAAAQVASVMQHRNLPAPNIDFALAALTRATHMCHGASEAIMAIARTAGFVAHALEEYRAPTAFPWHSLYVGPRS